MDIKSFFGDVSIGKDTSGKFKPSIKGLAVQTGPTTFAAFDGNELVEIPEEFTFNGFENYIYRLPVKEVKRGDLIVTADDPLKAYFIHDVKDGAIRILDPWDSTLTEYVQPTSAFEFKFFVKVVSLIGGLGSEIADNNLLLLLLLADKSASGSTNNNLMPLLLMQGFGGTALTGNTLLLLSLLNDNKSDLLETLLLMQAFGGDKMTLNLFGQSEQLPASKKRRADLMKS